jgi:hypothetical protein
LRRWRDSRPAALLVSNEADTEAETRPLLGHSANGTSTFSKDINTDVASSISWHFHNAVLLALSIITILWNNWLSETGGHCGGTAPITIPTTFILRVWFWPVTTPHIISQFPLLAWTSFSIIGLLYGRLLIATSKSTGRRWGSLSHALTGCVFLLVFVLTRVLRFGNLTEGCLRAPEHLQQSPGANPYLASLQSFLYASKYPPDLAFWSQTLAGCFFILALFETLPARAASWRPLAPLLDYGASPLFFYVGHMFVLVAAAFIIAPLFSHPSGHAAPGHPLGDRVIDNPAVMAITLLAVLGVMWPLCRWYSRFKSTKSKDSLWRFF